MNESDRWYGYQSKIEAKKIISKEKNKKLMKKSFKGPVFLCVWRVEIRLIDIGTANRPINSRTSSICLTVVAWQRHQTLLFPSN